MNKQKAKNIAIRFWNKYKYQLLLLLFVLPAFFINLNNSHSWGDDFAQYILQAKYLFEGKVYDNSPLLNYQEFCPFQRGAGFSMIITPVYGLSGLQIRPFLILVSLFYIFLQLILYNFFKSNLRGGAFIPMLLVFAFAYNHQVLKLKAEILPEFVFILLVYLSLLFVDKRSFWIVLLGVLVGFLISVKLIGLTVYVTIIVYWGIGLCKVRSKPNVIKFVFFLIVVPVVYFGIKAVVFRNLKFNDFIWYNSVYSLANAFDVASNNLLYYSKVLLWFFEKEVWFWLNQLIKVLVVVLFLTGLIYRWVRKFNFIDLFFIVYLFALLFYNYSESGVRFLIPILPIVLLYIVSALNVFKSIKIKTIFGLAVLFLLIFSNVKSIQLLNSTNKGLTAPHMHESIQAFKAVKNFTDEDAVVAFPKPWIICLYTDRKAIQLNLDNDFKEEKLKLKTFGVEYLLLPLIELQPNSWNQKITDDINKDENIISLWANKNFCLYKIKE